MFQSWLNARAASIKACFSDVWRVGGMAAGRL
jgi:hypothetical protein